MALRASHGRVCPRQRELRLGVIKGRRLPGRRRMASLAIRRETGRDVVRIGCGIKLLLMTSDTGQCGAGIDPVDVAGCASRCYVRPGQREPGRAVVETGRLPGSRVVTHGAIRRERGQHMFWTDDVVIVRLVARNALNGGSLISIILMALGAEDNRMSAGEWELGL